MIKCPNCGTEITDDALFCSECGKKIMTAVAAEDKIIHAPLPGQERNAVPDAALVNPSIPTISSSFAGDIPVQAPSQKTQDSKDIKHFLQVSLPDLTGKILFDPL